MNIKVFAFVTAFFMSTSLHASDAHEAHLGHNDALMVLLSHKIALQKLQGEAPTSETLSAQTKHIKQAMPILNTYMSTPKSYYLTTEMYHDSLVNRAAMLSDFSVLLIEYQKQLVSLP